MIGNILIQVSSGSEAAGLPLGKVAGKGETQGPGDFMELLQALSEDLKPEMVPQDGLPLSGQVVTSEGRPAKEDLDGNATEGGGFSASILDLLVWLREVLPRVEEGGDGLLTGEDGLLDEEGISNLRRDVAMLSRSMGLRPEELLQALGDVVRGSGGEDEKDLLQGLVSAGLSKEKAEEVIQELREKVRGLATDSEGRAKGMDEAKVNIRTEKGSNLLNIGRGAKREGIPPLGGEDRHPVRMSRIPYSEEMEGKSLSHHRGKEGFQEGVGVLVKEVPDKKVSVHSGSKGEDQGLDRFPIEEGHSLRDLNETKIVMALRLEKGKEPSAPKRGKGWLDGNVSALTKAEVSTGPGGGLRADIQIISGVEDSTHKVAGERARQAVITAVNQLISMRRIPGGVRLRLFPPELGSLRIDLQMKGGDLLVKILPEEVSAHHLLKEHVEAIHQHLSHHLSFGEVKIELLPPMEGSRNAQEDLWQGGGNPQHREGFPGRHGKDGEDLKDGPSFRGIFQEAIDVVV